MKENSITLLTATKLNQLQLFLEQECEIWYQVKNFERKHCFPEDYEATNLIIMFFSLKNKNFKSRKRNTLKLALIWWLIFEYWIIYWIALNKLKRKITYKKIDFDNSVMSYLMKCSLINNASFT